MLRYWRDWLDPTAGAAALPGELRWYVRIDGEGGPPFAPTWAQRLLEPLRIVDLFAGAGGLSQGFRQAGFRIIGGSDHDPDACATYAANFPEARTICGDIRHDDIKQQVLDAALQADVVVGGPPCQAFSQVRNHSRIIDDPRNSLYREFVDIVAHARPSAFLMENVPGMAQMGVLEQVRQDLVIGGAYEVNAQVLDAANFGVPQTRKRLIFFGVRRDLNVSPMMPTGSGATATSTFGRLVNLEFSR